MNSVLGSGKLVVAPAGNEHATLLQAAVSGTKDSAAGPQAASISVSLWPRACPLRSPHEGFMMKHPTSKPKPGVPTLMPALPWCMRRRICQTQGLISETLQSPVPPILHQVLLSCDVHISHRLAAC